MAVGGCDHRVIGAAGILYGWALLVLGSLGPLPPSASRSITSSDCLTAASRRRWANNRSSASTDVRNVARRRAVMEDSSAAWPRKIR